MVLVHDAPALPALSTSIISISKDQGHLSYGIMVHYGGRRWVVYKRYSEFRHLRASLLDLTAASGCGCRCLYLPLSSMPFPRKTLFCNQSDQVAIERRAALSQFLAVTLRLLHEGNDNTPDAVACEATYCPILPLLKTFLQVQRHSHKRSYSNDLVDGDATDVSSVSPIYTIKEGAEAIDCSPRVFCVTSQS
ncbi:Aste57867_1125 [Aphanomyces stellatus]|uniref:Aste57867_1125 protein n=1 Tax=Aphanomyces stellatus TaxID=120398 RepID=A0A485K5H0_9STRA|nr:hypothetical protein As57867_001124 [Aphanomyces stellatus]VFT78346.1 Aste57867_1125 [Aphanomyces stellatus]